MPASWGCWAVLLRLAPLYEYLQRLQVSVKPRQARSLLFPCCSQKPVASWALGGADQEFSSGAVYDYDTNLLFAPLRQRGTSGGKSGSVLEWSADDTVGTITGLARPMHLPPLHAVFPLSGASEGEEAEAAAAAAEEAEAAAIDGSGAARAGAVAVFASGGAALCGCGEVVAEVEEARGQHTVAAAFQPAPFQAAGELAWEAAAATSQQQARRQGTLVLVHSDPRSGAVAASAYHVAGGQFEVAVPAAELTAPSAGARAVGATATPERTAVLWSDGAVAVYAVPGDKQPLGTIPGQPSGPGVPLAKRRLAGFRLPAGKQHKGSGGKKRGAGGEPDASPAGVSLAAIRDKQVAVVGWATNAEGEALHTRRPRYGVQALLLLLLHHPMFIRLSPVHALSLCIRGADDFSQ